ncbi:MAG: substrate-binding domain-containing protein, partial [Clostridia bacterium]|nr:substrate-binding domain-containing protein [Clostridia bacterium]
QALAADQALAAGQALAADRTPEEIPYEDTFQFRFWQERTQGFTERMRELGLEPAGFFQGNGRFDFMSRQADAVVDAVLRTQDRPTALYCENDMIAIAMLNALRRRGIRVPEDMALIGHDGLDLCGMVLPNLTTIAQPRYEMGCEAAKLLIDQIERDSAPRTVLLKPALRAGETA